MLQRAHLPCECGANRWQTVSRAGALYKCRTCGHIRHDTNCWTCKWLVPCEEVGMIGIAVCSEHILSCGYLFFDQHQLQVLKRVNDCIIWAEKSDEEKEVFRRITYKRKDIPKYLK